jgi:hypothetical protein
MSDTPRTDAVVLDGLGLTNYAADLATLFTHARQLERELAAQKARADALEKLNAELHQRISDEVAKYSGAYFQWREAMTELEKRATFAEDRLNKARDLIATLRNALQLSADIVHAALKITPDIADDGELFKIDAALAATPSDSLPDIPAGSALSRYVDELRSERNALRAQLAEQECG